jgi:hypothetical protein
MYLSLVYQMVAYSAWIRKLKLLTLSVNLAFHEFATYVEYHYADSTIHGSLINHLGGLM